MQGIVSDNSYNLPRRDTSIEWYYAPVQSCIEALAVHLNLCKRAITDSCWKDFSGEELVYIFDRLEKRAKAIGVLCEAEDAKKKAVGT